MKRQIIVVEDDPWMRSFLKELLSGDYSVATVDDGSRALDVIQNGPPPDLVTLDLRMPGTDGLALVKALRADERFLRLPLLVLSSSDTSADRVACLRAGADDFMLKPFNPDELLARIENLFRRCT